MSTQKSYSEMIKLNTFEERFNYLALSGGVGVKTFGYDRYLNQALYHSPAWQKIRREVIIRDNGCDLGIEDRQLFNRVIIHHINPITKEDIEKRNPIIFDMENLVCTAYKTHEAIHYGNMDILVSSKPTERKPNDTCPWRE